MAKKAKKAKSKKTTRKKMPNGNFSDFYYASKVIKAHDREGGKERVRAHKRTIKVNLKRILTFLIEFGVGYVGVKAFLKWLGEDYHKTLNKVLKMQSKQIGDLQKGYDLAGENMEYLAKQVMKIAQMSGQNKQKLMSAIASKDFQDWLLRQKGIDDLGKPAPGK